MRTLYRFALGLLPLVVLLALLEVVFWVGGMGGDEQLSLSRGFDRSAAYIVPDPEVAGGFRTQMWEVDYLEVAIPPKTDAKRLILFGGSNTQGFPEPVLEMLLDIARPQDRWEVVNLGRSGYGSERVSILLEQAMDLLAPDAVLIYCGHNEFMERGFRDQLAEQGALSLTGKVAKRFMRLRTMRLITAQLEPDLKDRSFDRKPEPRIVGRDKSYRTLSLDDTLSFWRAYQANLRRMCETARAGGAAVILSTIIGNDFSSPYVANINSELEYDVRKAYGRLRRVSLEFFPERLRRHLMPPVRLDQPDWGVTLRPEERDARLANPPAGARVVPALRTLTGRLAAMPATDYTKARSIEGAHWSDPRLWTSAVHELLATLAVLHARDITEDERAQLRRADEGYGRALDTVPGHPQALYEHGLVKYLLGETDAARRLLRAAADADRAPRRGNDVSNDLVRAVAASVPGVELVDVDAVWRSRVPDELIGYEVMTDVCHLQPGARTILMADFVRAVVTASEQP